MAWPAVRLCMGASMPLLGLGTWRAKQNECYQAVKTALQMGYRHIDTAEYYQNEKEIGQALLEQFTSGLKREEAFVTSKLWNTRHHPDDVLPACQRSLTDLGLDYLDLYLMHFPVAYARGDNFLPYDDKGQALTMDIHFMDTWKSMEQLVDAGLVKAIGVSSFNISQMEEVLTNGRIKPAVNQVESHPYLGCHRLLEYCTAKGVVLTAFCPLARPGSKEAEQYGVASLLQDPVIVEISKKHGKTPAQVCLKWQVQRNVAVIPMGTTPAMIQENSQLFDFELSEAEMSSINMLDKNGRMVWFQPSETHPLWPFNEEF
ncbi:aldo-keto reductase family 1 member A1-A-like [Branchiostoma floridae]|uniref:Aldo-keto reductase family 1 member A1-A-like n=1 Tax=Branchiostoma floridae TaxID=7739 RepID=A0A9J7HN03_BRAFL|nr:aldo-keto reductase family 1 member A1-A-like [Branchiostoma floridae]XP_035662546.1 aldo-keto reductase family 1 member A1-A-like [Branchiostoma floridae]